MNNFKTYNEWIFEGYEIKSEKFWNQILVGKKFEYAKEVLDTIMKKQNGIATERQWNILQRAKRGNVEKYSTKN